MRRPLGCTRELGRFVTVRVSEATTTTTIENEEQAAQVALAVADQLKEARTAATGWQVGLAALLATITSIFFIKGKDSFDDIGGSWHGISWQNWVVVVLVAAAVFACLSSYFLLSAANGNPRSVNVNTIINEGLYVYNYRRAEHSADQLRNGQIALFLMLALVVTAIVITWRAPTATSEPAFHVIDPSTGACGDLTKADNGQLKIVQDSNSQEIVPKSSLDSLRLVPTCP
jgi:hypothetical protein